jgi:hypothetical protein
VPCRFGAELCIGYDQAKLFLFVVFVTLIVPKVIMPENCRLHNKTKYSWIMIFAAREPPQYIMVPPTGGKARDMVHISQ